MLLRLCTYLLTFGLICTWHNTYGIWYELTIACACIKWMTVRKIIIYECIPIISKMNTTMKFKNHFLIDDVCDSGFFTLFFYFSFFFALDTVISLRSYFWGSVWLYRANVKYKVCEYLYRPAFMSPHSSSQDELTNSEQQQRGGKVNKNCTIASLSSTDWNHFTAKIQHETKSKQIWIWFGIDWDDQIDWVL